MIYINYNILLIIIFIIRIRKKLESVINGPLVLNWIDFVGIKSVLPYIYIRTHHTQNIKTNLNY